MKSLCKPGIRRAGKASRASIPCHFGGFCRGLREDKGRYDPLPTHTLGRSCTRRSANVSMPLFGGGCRKGSVFQASARVAQIVQGSIPATSPEPPSRLGPPLTMPVDPSMHCSPTLDSRTPLKRHVTGSHLQQICTHPTRSPAWSRGGRREGGGCGNTPQLNRPTAMVVAWAGDLEKSGYLDRLFPRALRPQRLGSDLLWQKPSVYHSKCDNRPGIGHWLYCTAQKVLVQPETTPQFNSCIQKCPNSSTASVKDCKHHGPTPREVDSQ